MSRRILAAAVAVALASAVAAPARAAAAAPGFTDADYWAFAERAFTAMDGWWSPAQRAYVETGHRTPQVRINAGLLTVHAIAAAAGHVGLARNDERARVLVDRLTSPPVWRGTAMAGAASHTVCWSASMNRNGTGHASIEPKLAAALAWAWRERQALALPENLVRRIESQVGGCGWRPYWGFPPAVANQVNWNAELYAAGAMVARDGRLMRGRYRQLLGWFADGITRPNRGMETTNLGPSYAFHYLPYASGKSPLNADVPEYANITAQVVEFYERGLQLGMRPLPARSVGLLRAWLQRLLAGSWTHAGMLNWDTGWGQERWFSGQYWAFAQQGLLAIAASPRFRPAAYGRWAKAIFDRGLLLARRLGDEAGTPLPPLRLHGIRATLEDSGVYHVRLVVNAARAVALGLGGMRSEDPPPLYAFDFDTGRLAVTTPAYSTAIVPDGRGAFPYGGIELARLFGRDGRVAASTGGVPPAAFGLIVSSRSRSLADSQHARARPLRLLRSPRGSVPPARRYPARPDAGPFEVLEARGRVERTGVQIVSTNRFSRDAIRVRRDIRCTTRACRQARALFPTWGAGATIDAVRRDGTVVRLVPGGAPVPLRDVARLRLSSDDGDAGYAVVPLDGFGRATVHALAVRRQPTNPNPGPTLVLDQPLRGRGRTTLSVRLVPFA